MFCREQAARYGQHLGEIERLGAKVVAIGNGTAEMAADFVEGFGIRFPVYTDPSRRSYEAAGMLKAFGVNRRALRNAARALMHGHIQGRTKGHPWQQGGTIVLDGDAHPILVHADREAGDHLEVAEVLTALRQA